MSIKLSETLFGVLVLRPSTLPFGTQQLNAHPTHSTPYEYVCGMYIDCCHYRECWLSSGRLTRIPACWVPPPSRVIYVRLHYAKVFQFIPPLLLYPVRFLTMPTSTHDNTHLESSYSCSRKKASEPDMWCRVSHLLTTETTRSGVSLGLKTKQKKDNHSSTKKKLFQ